MLRSLLSGTEWQELADFASPSFLRLIGHRALFEQVRRLTSSLVDSSGFERVKSRRRELLAAAGLDISIGTPASRSMGRGVQGQLLLELYFHQLFTDGPTLLDLRRSRFSGDGPLHWQPASLYVAWEPGFKASICQLYRGFYADDDEAFRSALGRLGLEAAEDVFREHFGGALNGTEFRLSEFRRTFHLTFQRCRDAGGHLHPNFAALGVYLACLYEHLEGLGGAFDVRAAFQKARSASTASSPSLDTSAPT